MTIQELLAKIENTEIRDGIKAIYDEVNQKAGENGRKLIEKDQELDGLKKTAAKVTDYEKAFNLLKAKNVELKDIPGILDKMNIQKTADDDNKLLSEALKEANKKLQDLETKDKQRTVKDSISKIFAEERANFKNDKGEVLTVLDRFVNESQLYADVDVTNEVLLRERSKQVLQNGLTEQEKVKTEFGFQGAPTHAVNEGGNPTGGAAATVDLQEIAKTQGALGVIAAGRAARENSLQKV